ncbi:hypothetical protein TYRP_022284 [Tyrophagus putrescentiae]|nr:hypothetical protein TYRP_022284 [Tyrophagus putrescentiae]
MLKFTILFFVSCVALAAAAPAAEPTPLVPTLEDFQACTTATEADDKRCIEKLPPILKNSKDLHELAAHPELCCPAYTAFMCVENVMQKAEKCKKIWPLLKVGFDTQLKKFGEIHHSATPTLTTFPPTTTLYPRTIYNATTDEILKLIDCQYKWTTESRCFEKLPPGMFTNTTIRDHQLTAHPAELCCPTYRAYQCIIHFSEQVEPCKVILPLLLRTVNWTEVLTTKYHCQLEAL